MNNRRGKGGVQCLSHRLANITLCRNTGCLVLGNFVGLFSCNVEKPTHCPCILLALHINLFYGIVPFLQDTKDCAQSIDSSRQVGGERATRGAVTHIGRRTLHSHCGGVSRSGGKSCAARRVMHAVSVVMGNEAVHLGLEEGASRHKGAGFCAIAMPCDAVECFGLVRGEEARPIRGLGEREQPATTGVTAGLGGLTARAGLARSLCVKGEVAHAGLGGRRGSPVGVAQNRVCAGCGGVVLHSLEVLVVGVDVGSAAVRGTAHDGEFSVESAGQG